MTKKEKPELPPGKACFPQPPAIKPTELDPKTFRTRSIAIDELHRLNHPHTVRWLRVLEMYEMPPADFKKKHGYRKTLHKIHELVAEADAEDVGPQAIKKSCDLVDAEIEVGNGYKYFVADWPTRKLGKKRPRSR